MKQLVRLLSALAATSAIMIGGAESLLYAQNANDPTHGQRRKRQCLRDFLRRRRSWHNDAHMAVGMAIHHDLMDPRTNVRRPEFWRLHYFINDRLEEQLRHFGGAGSTPSHVVKQVEANAAAAPPI